MRAVVYCEPWRRQVNNVPSLSRGKTGKSNSPVRFEWLRRSRAAGQVMEVRRRLATPVRIGSTSRPGYSACRFDAIEIYFIACQRG